jgi:hypothetical protein
VGEVDDDARVVRDAVGLERAPEPVGRQELEDEPALGPRDREVLRVHGDRARDVPLREVLGIADVEEDETGILLVREEPVRRDEDVAGEGRGSGEDGEEERGEAGERAESGHRDLPLRPILPQRPSLSRISCVDFENVTGAPPCFFAAAR